MSEVELELELELERDGTFEVFVLVTLAFVRVISWRRGGARTGEREPAAAAGAAAKARFWPACAFADAALPVIFFSVAL